MPNPERRVGVLNLRDQPLEIHRGGEVLLLPPHGVVEVDEEELRAPQLAALVMRHLVQVVEPPLRAAPVPPAPPAAEAPAARAEALAAPEEPAASGEPRPPEKPTKAGKRGGKGEK